MCVLACYLKCLRSLRTLFVPSADAWNRLPMQATVAPLSQVRTALSKQYPMKGPRAAHRAMLGTGSTPTHSVLSPCTQPVDPLTTSSISAIFTRSAPVQMVWLVRTTVNPIRWMVAKRAVFPAILGTTSWPLVGEALGPTGCEVQRTMNALAAGPHQETPRGVIQEIRLRFLDAVGAKPHHMVLCMETTALRNNPPIQYTVENLCIGAPPMTLPTVE